ncbi:hypothetical protein FSP39_024869 [Pinctada imbricata]|uniref:long-chain-fatty-acid--CoA ligase n=1 Tax=Pinctada imbricata TaxID=66713 RepID=A0AA88YGP6_PINIB|nr:hypothetical protein FSP39_024869 [Pinctada imbricata]
MQQVRGDILVTCKSFLRIFTVNKSVDHADTFELDTKRLMLTTVRPSEDNASKMQTENGGAKSQQKESNNNASRPGQGSRTSALIPPDIDSVAPSQEFVTIGRDSAVKLRTQDTGPLAEKPLTIPSVFFSTVQRVPDNPAVAVKRGGVWKTWTYREYWDIVIKTAKSFIKLGLEPYHGVGIIGFNSPEWFFSDLGAIFAGGFAVGIYTTNSPEACEYVASNCEANIIVVENNVQLKKILQVWDKLPHLKAVVQYTGEVAEKNDRVYNWEDFIKLSADVPDQALQERLAQQAPNKACTLIYTSGTTGNPKGVMLSHDNLTWTARRCSSMFGLMSGEEVVVSYLPLSHVAAQMIDMHITMRVGATVYFAQPDALKVCGDIDRIYKEIGKESLASLGQLSVVLQIAGLGQLSVLTWTSSTVGKHMNWEFGKEISLSYLPLSHIAAQLLDLIIPMTWGGMTYFAMPDAMKGSLLTTLQEVRPTGFLGVPRVWEKFQEGIKEKARQRGGMARRMGAWARKVGLEASIAQMNKQSTPFGYSLAKMLVFNRLRKTFGLDRCKTCVSGAAPITKETLEFFYSLDIQLQEVYGMSESSGPQTVGRQGDFRMCSVGKEFPGAQTKFADVDEEGNGEICMNGRHVFMGYLGDEEKTKEAFDNKFWLRSGDLGKRDKDGFLFITGRKKELIITAGGENIAPVPIEDNVKECLPCISNCMLIGDKRKFLSMLITLKVEVNPDTGDPMDDLMQSAIDWCKEQGSQSTKVSQILDNKDSVVLKAIQTGIDKANEKAVSRAAKIQKWSLLPRDFSIPGGELGPTLKLRRPIVNKMYIKTIDAFYED